ncbi:tripartite tricarboxylate transporter substrate binding protein [Fusibacter ferrireducens]|uniref:Tripartite tricarboxylate transporter substrate binding protein n=1 Tax=Fusibacter ferrireducens TaxID=2785058 RepID=A0ABR9ZRR4_9FIRM|nr:tripartite tricarboxylate transporter substrate binding protein [Fusibacter ferrireducens]MBF4693146.1 tripartite tricarboxylate transporter substrate binding protein [Fusibacter ferrireducens]
MGKMFNKKFLVLFLALVMMSVTACGQETTEKENEAPAAADNTNNQAAASTASEADDWPSQPINIMVPASAGGGTDIFSRTLGEFITEETGAPVVITNQSGLAGYEMVRTQDPNGYNYAMAITGLLISKAQGDLDYGHEAYDPVGMISAETSTGIIVRADSPYQTVEDLFNAIKADPQSVVGGISMTGYPYLYMLAIEDALDIDLYCVDAGNSAERNTALLGEQVDYIISNAAVTKPYLESGDFKYLGIAAKERNAFIPDVPTFTELGYDLVFPGQAIYLVAPKGTDPEVIEKFNGVLDKILAREDFIEKMTSMSFGVVKGISVQETLDELNDAAATFEKYTK